MSLLPHALQPTLAHAGPKRFFETVATFHDPIEAEVVRGRLEAEGIPAIVADSNLLQVHSVLSGAVGGARVQVPPEHLEQAAAICEAIKAGQLTLDDS